MMSFGCHFVASVDPQGLQNLHDVCGFSELCNHDIPTMTMTMISIIPTCQDEEPEFPMVMGTSYQGSLQLAGKNPGVRWMKR